MESETHTVFLGAQVAAEQYGDRTPMTYDYYHKVIKGKSPKNAPRFPLCPWLARWENK